MTGEKHEAHTSDANVVAGAFGRVQCEPSPTGDHLFTVIREQTNKYCLYCDDPSPDNDALDDVPTPSPNHPSQQGRIIANGRRNGCSISASVRSVSWWFDR